MLFYLTSLHVSYVLMDSKPTDPYLVDGENDPTEAQVADYEKAASQWNHNEYNCRKYIMNALDDSLYDIYSTFANARDIYESLEKKYKTLIACSKKFVIGKSINFKINDAKPVVKQVEELQIIVHEMKLYLKHLTDDMSFEPLVLKIHVEEDNKMNEKADGNSIELNANMVGESSSKLKSSHKNKGKNGLCHKKDHGGKNSGGNSYQANNVESPKEFARVIESFLTTNVVDWWFDTGATKYMCNSRRMFVSYQKVNEPKPMFMGNGTALKIEGKGKVILKDLVLLNVLHVSNITKNLISGPILSNKGFKLVFESGKFVITKGGVYVGKGYLDEGLFKISIVTDDNVINNNNKAGTSTASVHD
ncbi:pol polyprotein [Tanacetum coccineum]